MMQGTAVPAVQEFKTGFSDDPDDYKNENVKDRRRENIWNDNFDTAVKPHLLEPTQIELVRNLVTQESQNEVVLWRGLQGSDVENMRSFHCAKGKQRDPSVGKPDDKDRKSQAQLGRQFPEFTTRTDLSYSFGHWLVVVRIQAKYLTAGSTGEDGWVCDPKAPIRLVAVVDRTLGFPEASKEKNASQ
jgi:hypothetical protein